MSFIDGIGEGEEYGKERIYSQDDLNRVMPGGVVRWMSLHPALDADPKNTLHFYKKKISFFMPDNLITWNSSRMDGNRTKNLVVNGLIKQVREKEVRK